MKNLTKYLSVILLAFGIFVLAMQGCNNSSQQQPSKDFVFKEKLSEYGFFKNKLKDMEPAEGVYYYNIVTPLFTDYAVKDRFIALPKGAHLIYTAHGPLDFPDSSFLIKSFAYINTSGQKVLVETRMMFKDPKTKKWEMMDYVWNKEQTDATKFIVGERIPITLLDNDKKAIATNYEVPDVNECKRCHINGRELIPIGPKARNLNYTIPGETQNQLAKWVSMGIIKGMPALDSVERLPDWSDSKNYTVDQRARAYLDVNCSYCHTHDGDAYNTGLYLEYDQKNPDHIGIMKMPVSAGGGAGGLNYDIVPGDAANSILLYRMNSREPGTAMPELTRTVVHKEGVQLIREWINEMKK